MIIKARKNELEIIHVHELKPASEDGESQALIQHDILEALKVTPDMIPKELFCVVNDRGWDSTTGNEIDNYTIFFYHAMQESLSLRFNDKNTALVYFEILNGDFEDLDLQAKHPEIFV